MKAGDDLPADDQIVRYVKPSLVEEDESVNGAGFCLRPDRPDDLGLSVNWLEAFGSNKNQQLEEVRRHCRLDLKPNGSFAEMNVGMVRRKVSEELDTLRIVHDPLEAMEDYDADPSHAEIIGLPSGNSDEAMLIGDLIAECVVVMHLAIT